MSIHEPHTIADYLRFGAEDLRDASETPRLDAEVLLGAVLDCDRAYLFAYSDRMIDDTASDLFRHYVERRKAGEPVAYIIGKREFWSLLLTVNDSTLIPRPDTEILVETALQYCTKDQAYVIDLGTGTGAIALAMASEKPGWHIDAVDANENAVALATLNASQLALENVHVYRSDWFAGIRTNTLAPDAKFDMIVANPPYISAADPHLGCGDIRFEPRSALVSADGGYADLFAIARQATDFLFVNGLLLLEHGFEQAERVRNYLLELGYIDAQTVKDYGGNERVAVARWSGKAI
jgi:release factor glutamine methyltransferase